MRADAERNRARILAAAQEVFASSGPSASTEEVAARAGVAIGTVFRHFPTKDDLLRAIAKDLLERLGDEVATAPDLYAFFASLVAQAAARKAVFDLLEVQPARPVMSLRPGVEQLLARSQRDGLVRSEVSIDEVMALLTSTCQGALQAG